MANLHRRDWVRLSTENNFSSEDSMRDYLFKAPRLFFDINKEDDLLIPIKEEKYLSETNLTNKNNSRIDILICRIPNKSDLPINKKAKIKVWVIELKNKEASYKNGFEQLFDYITVIKNSKVIQDKLKDDISSKVKKENIKSEFIQNATLDFFGSLVAPSFDLMGKNKKTQLEKGKKGKDWKNLQEKVSFESGKSEEFNLIEVITASYKLKIPITLTKIKSFVEDKKEWIYMENILGHASEIRIDIKPEYLFEEGIIEDDDEFYYKLDELDGKRKEEVRCEILKEGGKSNAFKARILSIGKGIEKMPMVSEWKDKGETLEWREDTFPIEDTVRNCSIGLYFYFEKKKGRKEDEIRKDVLKRENSNKSKLGENNFVRKEDNKSLRDLRMKYRRKHKI